MNILNNVCRVLGFGSYEQHYSASKCYRQYYWDTRWKYVKLFKLNVSKTDSIEVRCKELYSKESKYIPLDLE